MMTISDQTKLLDGREMPVFGFGCYNSYGDEITKAVATAIEIGYRYIEVSDSVHGGAVWHKMMYVF
mgnify:CR=1 FL=1